MATLAAGTRLLLQTDDGPVALRALAPVAMADLWSIPVLASASRPLGGLAGEVEVPTEGGVLRLQAHLVSDGPVLSLRPGLTGATRIQRRDDVRAQVRLPIRAAAGHAQRLAPADPQAVVDGTTVSLSAGGLGVRLEPGLGARLGEGGRLYAELELPGGQLVPVVLAVVDHGPDPLRARFAQIANADRERLVGLVFEQQRRELAARKRLMDGLLDPG